MSRASCLALLCLVACGDDDSAPMDSGIDADPPVDAYVPPDVPPVMQPTFDDDHVYTRPTPPYESADACRVEHPDAAFVCTQSLVFCPSGDFTLRLTSTTNAGGYALRDGGLVQAQRRGVGDGPMRFDGVADDDAATFTTDADGLAGTWARVEGSTVCL